MPQPIVLKVEKDVSNGATGEGMDYEKFLFAQDAELLFGDSLSLSQLRRSLLDMFGIALPRTDDDGDVIDTVDEAAEWMRENVEGLSCDNSYNWAYWGPTFVFCTMGEEYDDGLVIISMHIGGDVRGNYMPYQAFKMSSTEFLEKLFEWMLYVTIKTDQGDIIIDAEDTEAAYFTVGRDETGTFEEGDSVNSQELDKALDWSEGPHDIW